MGVVFIGCVGWGEQDYLQAGCVLLTGSPSVVADSFSASGYALECDASGSSPAVYYPLTAAAIIVGTLIFQVQSGSSTQYFAGLRSASTNRVVFGRKGASGTAVRMLFAGTDRDSSVTLADNTTCRIDFRLDMSANPWTIDWQVNGIAQTQYTNAVAAATANRVLLGWNGSTTGKVHFGDLALSSAVADYPLGTVKCLYYPADADGSHSVSAGNFREETSGTAISNATTDAYTYVNGTPGSSAAYLEQYAAATTEYVEVTLADPLDGSIIGVEVKSLLWASTAGSSDQTLKLNDGGTLDSSFSGNVGSATPVGVSSGGIHCGKAYATSPNNGSQWLPVWVAALRLRWGYSSFSSGITARVSALGIEVCYRETLQTYKQATQVMWIRKDPV